LVVSVVKPVVGIILTVSFAVVDIFGLESVQNSVLAVIEQSIIVVILVDETLEQPLVIKIVCMVVIE
jgi:HD-like signal output (HDOD) protein